MGSRNDVPGLHHRCSGLNLSVNGGDRVHDAVDGDLVAYEEPWGPSRR